ncbi:MAG: hypothetical protein FWF49_02285 [Oscillospiraceae bacterium]|nr:hypothetical protein [Oscillospiraceae bacterium]
MTALKHIQAVQAGIDAAREYAAAKGLPLTMARVADFLGVDEETLQHYCALRDGASERAAIARALRRVRQTCRADLLDALMNKNCNAEGIKLVGREFGLESASAANGADDVVVRFVEPGGDAF